MKPLKFIKFNEAVSQTAAKNLNKKRIAMRILYLIHPDLDPPLAE